MKRTARAAALAFGFLIAGHIAHADPIHEAAGAGKLEKLRRILGEGVDVNAKSGGGSTPLHDAAMWGHRDITELLLSKGADVNAKDGNGMTPLHFAANGDHKALAGLLIARGADLNARASNGWTPLHVAAVWGHAGTAKVLIDSGADINVRSTGGGNPLRGTESSARCHKDMNALVGKKGAGDYEKEAAGMTPLRAAVLNGQEEMAGFLKKHGAVE